MDENYITKAFEAYVTCALWSSLDEEGTPLDENYSAEDISEEASREMLGDVHDFCESNAELLANISPEMAGHDFWLTRNRHGAGFWDRGLGEVGDRLTEMAHPFGESDLYVGDDGKLYI